LLIQLLFLLEFLQEGLREFKMRYSAASIHATLHFLLCVFVPPW